MRRPAKGETQDDTGRALAPEALVRASVNEEILLTWSCTPRDLSTLAVGWLVCQGAVREPGDLAALEEVDPAPGYAASVQIRLTREAVGRLERSLGPGVPASAPPAAPGHARDADFDRIDGLRSLLEDRATMAGWFRDMFERADLRSTVGGVHTGGLILDGRLAGVVEDVSRHHVVDRLVGVGFRSGEPLAGAILTLSARISGAMAAKACRAGVGALVSRSIPTELAASLAGAGGLILVGRARHEEPHYYWPSGYAA